MKIKLDLYKVFKVVCEKGSISSASKELFISQSAVSQAIKQLESQVGISLLRRSSKGVFPTGEGQIIYEYASSAIDLLDSAERKIDEIKNLSYGTLKICASDTSSRYILLPILEKFNKSYPNIKLEIVNRTTMQGVGLLKSGMTDIAIINIPYVDEDINIDSFMEIHDIFVASKNRKDIKNIFSIEQVSKLPIILLEKNTNSRYVIDDFFNKSGFSISPEIELGSYDLLLEFAKINLGVSCVVKEFSQNYLTTGELVELKTDFTLPKRHLGVARLKGVSLSSASRIFLQEFMLK